MDLLDLDNMIKSTLVSIDFEIKENFNSNYNNWDSFIEEVDDILKYYRFTIYKNAKKSIMSKLDIKISNELDDVENDNIKNYNFDNFLNKLLSGIKNSEMSKEDLLEQILLIIIGECIVLFKKFQIDTCRLNNIKYVKFISDDNCCEICKLNSNILIDVNEFDLDNIHPYCKTSIIPLDYSRKINMSTKVCNITHMPSVFKGVATKITTKLFINCKDLITEKDFVFIDNGNKIIESGNRVTIPIDLLNIINIEKILVKYLLKDKLLEKLNISEWEALFNIKKDSRQVGDNCIVYSLPFINNLAQNSCEEYIIQNTIHYILDAKSLYSIDRNAYEKLKIIIKKEFI